MTRSKELIAGLERALPAETWSEILPYEVFCAVTDVLLYGTPRGKAGVRDQS
jgi:hypothetical protein